jgi:hypothetical protein
MMVRMVDSLATCVLYVLYLPQSPKPMIAVNSLNRAICKTAYEILYTRKQWVRRLCENPRSIITIASETSDTWVVQYVSMPGPRSDSDSDLPALPIPSLELSSRRDRQERPPRYPLETEVSPGPSLNSTPGKPIVLSAIRRSATLTHSLFPELGSNYSYSGREIHGRG